MAVVERCGHQLGGLVDREPEHDALIAGAFFLVLAGIHPLRDVRGLAVEVVREAGSRQWNPSCS